jgi:hypothetical protein
VTGDPVLHYLRRGQAEGRVPLRVVPVPLPCLPLPCLPLTDANYRTWIDAAESGRSRVFTPPSNLRKQAATTGHPHTGHHMDTRVRGYDGHERDPTTIGISSDAVLFLPPGTTFAPGALREIAAVLAAHPETEVIYADEDCMDANWERCAPWFKPDWDPILAETCDLTGGVGVARRTTLERLGRPEETTLYALAQAAGPDRVRHIPRVLFHRPLSSRARRGNLADPTHAFCPTVMPGGGPA